MNNNWAKITEYHSFSEPNVCLAQLQINLCRAAKAKTQSKHFWVSLKCLVCN